jgi:hypothetical protein
MRYAKMRLRIVFTIAVTQEKNIKNAKKGKEFKKDNFFRYCYVSG